MRPMHRQQLILVLVMFFVVRVGFERYDFPAHGPEGRLDVRDCRRDDVRRRHNRGTSSPIPGGGTGGVVRGGRVGA